MKMKGVFMYSDYGMPRRPRPNGPNYNDRFIGGGFLGPFILGGLTGGLVAPFFGGYGPRPYNYSYNNYYYPYPPCYGPYCR